MFSFVDQITDLDGGSVRGRFAVPPHFGGAPDWLIAEAIGQLAGWAAMRAADFRVRPVGARLGALSFHGCRRPTGVIGLSATIERTDRRAILYHGAVFSGEVEMATMHRCIGPLLPMEVFEDPERARARFEALRGAHPIELWGLGDPLPEASLALRDAVGDGSLMADFHVAGGAPLFREHFPNQPVVPATLLIEAMGRTASAAFARNAGTDVENIAFDEVLQVKVRRFTKPGENLVLDAAPPIEQGDRVEVPVVARNSDEKVAAVRAVFRQAD